MDQCTVASSGARAMRWRVMVGEMKERRARAWLDGYMHPLSSHFRTYDPLAPRGAFPVSVLRRSDFASWTPA